MKPRGRPPAALVRCDDLVFDMHCNADSQVLNTKELLAYMDRADDDGRIDSDEWGYVVRHVRLEDRWNGEQLERFPTLRHWMNATAALVAELRRHEQVMNHQVVRG